MEIKKLNPSIDLILEQYFCETCKKKSYINSEDKGERNVLICPFCNSGTYNIRQFKIKIERIGEYPPGSLDFKQ